VYQLAVSVGLLVDVIAFAMKVVTVVAASTIQLVTALRMLLETVLAALDAAPQTAFVTEEMRPPTSGTLTLHGALAFFALVVALAAWVAFPVC
jgi:phosphate/sulfate permease